MTTLLEHLEGLNERATYPASNYPEADRAREAFIELDELRRMYFPAFLEAVRCAHDAWKELDRTAQAPDVADRLAAALAPFMEQVGGVSGEPKP